MEQEIQKTLLEQLTGWLTQHTGAFIKASEVADFFGVKTEGSVRWGLSHFGAFISTEEALTLGEKFLTALFGGK